MTTNSATYMREYMRRYYPKHRQKMIAATVAAARRRIVEPWMNLIKGARFRAKAKRLPFDLTAAWATARWTGRCELTGLAFRSYAGTGSRPNVYSASIDRIDSSLGYTRENCRFILFGLNALRGTGGDEDMYLIAAALQDRAGASQLRARPIDRPTPETGPNRFINALRPLHYPGEKDA